MDKWKFGNKINTILNYATQTIIEEGANDDNEMNSKNVELDERFEEVQLNLLNKEENFISQLIKIQFNGYYIELQKANRQRCLEVFGLLERLLEFHRIFKKKIEGSKSIWEVVRIFLSHKEDLKLHIQDQWKSPDSRTDLIGIDKEFYDSSLEQVKVYMDQLQEIKYEKEDELKNDDDFKQVFEMILDIYTQIQYVSKALKLIIDAPIILEECGRVLYKEKISVQNLAMMKKGMDFFFTTKYVIITEAKDDRLVCIDCWPIKSVNLSLGKKEKPKISYGVVNRRVYTLEMKNQDGVTEKIRNILDDVNK